MNTKQTHSIPKTKQHIHEKSNCTVLNIVNYSDETSFSQSISLSKINLMGHALFLGVFVLSIFFPSFLFSNENKPENVVVAEICDSGIGDGLVLTSGTVSSRVAADSDDAEEELASGDMNLGSSDLELAEDGGDSQLVGMRFNGITVPPGATITSAYVEFETDAARSGACNLTIYGEDADNASGFTWTDFDISSRAKTTATQVWSPPDWNNVDEKHQTPDISAIVQEIVDRGGWASGNSMVIMIDGTGRREAESHDGESAAAPLLVIEYDENAAIEICDNGIDDDGDGLTDGADPDCSGCIPGTVSSRVETDSDDAEESLASGDMNLGSSDLELAEDGGDSQLVGMRFNGITVPPGASITSAYVEFETDAARTGACNLTIYGEDADNASGFTSADFDISSRAKTTATQAWSPPDWNNVNEKHQSPDISAIVQEIVGRGGWASGNSMVIMIDGTGRREAESHDGESAAAPLLVIEYEECPGIEICDNGIDDDGDGLTDCDDPDCPSIEAGTIAQPLFSCPSNDPGIIDNISMPFEPFAPACNEVSNPEFDSGNSNWNAYVQAGNSALFNIDNSGQLSGANSAHIDISTATGTNWHIQLAQNGHTIEVGKTYSLRFKAKATAAKDIAVHLSLNGAPYTNYWLQFVSLNNTEQIFEFHGIQVTATVIANINLLFDLGVNNEDVWIDDVYFGEQICSSSAYEYQWLTRADNGSGGWTNWSTISGANNSTYDPPAISQNTQYMRQARVAGSSNCWVSSNIASANLCPDQFICDNKFYQTIKVSGEYWLYEVTTDPVNLIPLHNLSTSIGFTDDINGAIFNKADGFIYFIELHAPYRLYRLGSDFDYQYVGDVSGFPAGYFPNAAGIDDNGKIFYRGAHNSDIYELNLSDLSASLTCDFPSWSAQTNNIGDIAFCPTDGSFYGSRDSSTTLMVINTDECDTSTVNMTEWIDGALGAFYIAPDGMGYGYANNTGNFYRVNLADGQVDLIGTGPTTSQTDGCSCQGIKFTKDVNPGTTGLGTTVTYTFTIYNNWNLGLSNIEFRDTLQDGFLWASEPYNTAGGITLGSTSINGGAIAGFNISNLPIGIHSFQIDAFVPADYSGSNPNMNQAYLKNLPVLLGESKPSDYPPTPEIDDPTPVVIVFENCSNGIDDDGDGLIDCADGDCPGVIVTASGAATICSGNNAIVSASAIGSGSFTYSWSNGLGNGASKNVSPASTTTYTVTATSSTGCIGTDQVTVTVNQTPAANAGDDESICRFSNTILSASASGGTTPYNYSWSHAPGTGNDKTISPLNTTTYTVTVTSNNGCNDTDQITITVTDCNEICGNGTDDDGDGLTDCDDDECGPSVSLGADLNNCASEDITLTASTSGGDGPLTVTWSHGLGTGASKTVAPATTTTYSVTVTAPSGCAAIDDVTVTVVPCSENCYNGIDDDGDGLIDCADPDCQTVAAPQLEPDNYTSCPGLIYSDRVTYNDENLQNPVFSIAAQPTYGTVTIDATGKFIYTPNGLDCTTDNFIYQVCNQLSGCCATATVDITLGDNTFPVLTNVPADLTISCDDIVPDAPVVTGFDECPGLYVTYEETSTQHFYGACESYTITRTWTAEDYCGNTVSESQEISVVDLTKPEIFQVYTLENGKRLVAGVSQRVTDHWKYVPFPITFEGAPVVVSQVTTNNDQAAIMTRQRNTSMQGFELRLVEEEGADGSHNNESVSWLAVEPGALDGNMKYVGGTLANLTDALGNLNFGQTFSGAPLLFTTLMTDKEMDPATVKVQAINGTQANIRLQEETSSDAETAHANENLGFFALENGHALTDAKGVVFGEAGSMNITNAWTSVSLNNTYTKPVVICGGLSANDADPANIRVRNVTSNSFEVRMQEWDYLDGNHGSEAISWMVVEGSIPGNQGYYCSGNANQLQPYVNVFAVDNCDDVAAFGYQENESNTGTGLLTTRTWLAIDDCGNTAIVSRYDTCVVAAVRLRGLLYGAAMNTGAGNLMRDDLRLRELIPIAEPYSDLNSFSHVEYLHDDLEGSGEELIAICVDKNGTPTTEHVSQSELHLYLNNGALVGACEDNPNGMVTICHKPGTPAEKTKTIPQSSLLGHLNHGDVIGPCSGSGGYGNGDYGGSGGNTGGSTSGPSNPDYETIADGNWTSSATWAGGNVPPLTDINDKVISITHNVTVQGSDVYLKDYSDLYVIGSSLTVTGGNFEIKKSTATFINSTFTCSSGNVYMTNSSGAMRFIESTVDLGQNFQNDKGALLMRDVCLNLAGNFELIDGTDSLINVCAIIDGNFDIKEGTYAHLEDSQFKLTNGNFKNDKGAVTGGNLVFYVENGSLENVQSGDWSAPIAQHCVSGSVDMPSSQLMSGEDCGSINDNFNPCSCDYSTGGGGGGGGSTNYQGPWNADYSTIANGNWSDPAVWEGGIVPPFTNISGKVITITNNVTVQSSNIKLKDNAELYVIGGSLTMLNGKFEIERSFASFNHSVFDGLTAGEFTLKKNESRLYVEDCVFKVGQDLKLEAGTMVLKDVCLEVGADLFNHGTDTLINVCAIIHGKVHNHHAGGMYAKDVKFRLPNGDFENKGGTLLSGENLILLLETGKLKNEGTWTASVSEYCVAGDIIGMLGNLPLLPECVNIANYFTPCVYEEEEHENEGNNENNGGNGSVLNEEIINAGNSQGNGEIDPALLEVTGDDAIVDWVLLELRNAADDADIVGYATLGLQRDGDVITEDGDDVVVFPGLGEGDYFVALRHRNHIGLMTDVPHYLSTLNPPLLDFSDPLLELRGGETAGRMNNGKRLLWAGDFNEDGRVVYQGPYNDVFFLFSRVLADDGNSEYLANYIVNDYDLHDVNLDGRVIYQGPNNDRAPLLYHSILSHPNNGSFLANFIVSDNLP